MPEASSRRKLRALVITMGGEREEQIKELFEQMKEDFASPDFSPGVPSRSIRSCYGLLQYANEAGILPTEEWEALQKSDQKEPPHLFDCLENVTIAPGRRGSQQDMKLHYSVELWRKGKGLNRGRGVLGCLLAHLIAMRKCVDEGYDLILEDNVRGPPEECAKRIWETMEASKEWERDGQRDDDCCHLRYYGWLGSTANIRWVMQSHRRRMRYCRKVNQAEENNNEDVSFFPFPVSSDVDVDKDEMDEVDKVDHDGNDGGRAEGDNKIDKSTNKPGGTSIWGAYAYWVSSSGLDALLDRLRNDVGALVWKGKKMRCHVVKPIDKVLPRQIKLALGRDCIHVTSHPAFFRAPMLTSKLHTKWDPDFCRSTEFQMKQSQLTWDDLWLTKDESDIIQHKRETGIWITMAQLSELRRRTETDDINLEQPDSSSEKQGDTAASRFDHKHIK